MYGIGRGPEGGVQDVDLHLHLRFDISFQVKLRERPEQTHVPMYVSVDIAEDVFYKRLQEREWSSSVLDLKIKSFHLRRNIAGYPSGAGTVATDVGIQAHTSQFFIP